MINRMYEMGQVSGILNLFKYPCYMRNLCVYLHVLCYVHLLSRVQLCATLWTIACQAPLSMGFPRKEYWSGLPFPPPGDLPNPRLESVSPALQADSLPIEPKGKLLTS